MIILTEERLHIKVTGGVAYDDRAKDKVTLDVSPMYDEKQVKMLAANHDRRWADAIDKGLEAWGIKIDRSKPHKLVMLDPETEQYGVELSIEKI